MSLRPDPTLQKFLISTTSRLVGEYETEGLLITHAWPDTGSRSALARWEEGPTSRSAYVLALRTEEHTKAPGKPLPDYSATGDVCAAYLSVLFGKRFDHHGLLEGTGFYKLPEMASYATFCDRNLPFNSHAFRSDFPVPLNLAEVARFGNLIQGTVGSRFDTHFRGATKFYLQAIQAVEREPEIAYLHLITCGEILSNAVGVPKSELLDDATKALLQRVRAEVDGGEAVAKHIAGKLLQVRRRFVQAIVSLVDNGFFARTEAEVPNLALRQANFEKTVGAAYDVRSKYVHVGAQFGAWVMHGPGRNAEISIGRPVIPDKEFAKVLHRAPTFVGLERLIRYCLLRFAEKHGAYVEPAAPEPLSATKAVTVPLASPMSDWAFRNEKGRPKSALRSRRPSLRWLARKPPTK